MILPSNTQTSNKRSIFFMFLLCWITSVKAYIYYCETDRHHIQTLYYNADIGQYEIRSNNSMAPSNNNRLRILSSPSEQGNTNNGTLGTMVIDTRNHVEQMPPTIQAALCPCTRPIQGSPDYYCLATIQHCSISSFQENLPPTCLTIHPTDLVINTVWPVLLVWFLILFMVCVFMVRARHARDGCLNLLLSRTRNERIAERMLRNEPLLARLFIERYVQHNEPTMTREDVGLVRGEIKYEFVIKTRKLGRVQDEDHEGANDCAICYDTLRENDRVGVLQCRHVFHVECLKGWIVRKNRCPLCYEAKIAVPRVCVQPTLPPSPNNTTAN